jgi:hypothetical protein
MHRPALILPLLLLLSAPVGAQTPAPAAPAADIKLTPAELQEREQRKACKLALCAAFHTKTDAGPAEVSCNVLKTWRKEQLTKMVSKGGISWPWGNVQCTADLRFQRADLAQALRQPSFDLTLAKHQVKCHLDGEKEKYEVALDIAPKVQFKDGKAVKAQMNWGKIEAPLLAKSVLWSATAADNTFGALQSTVVEDVNDFIGPKCDEVKSEWAK